MNILRVIHASAVINLIKEAAERISWDRLLIFHTSAPL